MKTAKQIFLILAAIAGFLVMLTILCVGLLETAYMFERASLFLAIVDDFIIRLVAVALLVVASIALLAEEIERMIHGNTNSTAASGAKPPKGLINQLWSKFDVRSFHLFRFAALMGLMGGGFLFANELDTNGDMDKFDMLGKLRQQLEERTVGSPPVPIYARWAQVVPSESHTSSDAACVLGDFGAQADDGKVQPPKACGYDFLVRAVVPAAGPCPTVRVAYAGTPGSVREMRHREQPPNAGFREIQVCETRVFGDARPRHATFKDGRVIPLTKGWTERGGPRTIAVVGDSGCRADSEQSCTATTWRFGEVAQHMAGVGGAMADLAVHVGDTMYMKMDNWDAWKASFFDPAKPVLANQPWVMVRGNHERCGEHGDAPLGYALFFDPGPVRGCDGDDLMMTKTYAIDVSDTHRLVVADSSIAFAPDVSDTLGKNDQSGTAYDRLMAMMAHVEHLGGAETGKTPWLLTHVPIFALDDCDNPKNGRCALPGQAADAPESSAMMGRVWRDAGMDSSNVKTILVGDRHYAQFSVKGDDGPLQVTSGAGGVNLDPVDFLPDAYTFSGVKGCLGPDDVVAGLNGALNAPADENFVADWRTCLNRNFGYVLAKPGAGGDSFEFVPVADPPPGE